MEKQKLYPVIVMMAIAMGLYHMVNCYYSLVGTLDHRMLHLGFALILGFLTANQLGKRPVVQVLIIAVVLITLGYLRINLERLLIDMGFPLPLDVVAGFMLLAIVFVGCWLSFGIILPVIAFTLLLYGFFGHRMGGPILSVEEIVTTVCLTFGSYDLWGKILIVSANVIFLFVFFGHMLQSLRATDCFTELGKIIGTYSRSGPAMTAVISSCLMGTTAGQATPNIAVTGAFTIPLMKKVGYRPEVAASIEAAASGGGQIMPPIMGAGAFVMAELLGVPYSKIIVMATIPAMLYFVSVGIFVHLQAIKSNVRPLPEKVDKKRLYATAPLFIVPLMAILGLLFWGYPPMVSAFWGIVTLIGLSFLRKETRPSLRQLMNGCVRGATTGARVAIACATLGPIIALVTKTGLGLKVGYSVELWSGGNLFLGLVILMIAVIILGLEVPTVAAYLIAAMVAIPALVRLGLDPLQAHMFAYYFGALSGLTPPVGMAAIVASKLANASYMKTALYSINAAVAGFVVPFVFVYNGALLLLPGHGVFSVIMAVALTLLGLAVFQIGFVGYLVSPLNLVERAGAILSGTGVLVFVSTGRPGVLFPTAVLLAVVWFRSLKKRRQNKSIYSLKEGAA